MIFKKVHRGIKFYQSPWMEPYIRKNTELRKLATSSFEKDFFKLMNNSVFGKTIENIRKRQNVILVDNRKKAAKLSTKPNFERATIFDENLIAVHMKKTEVYFNKPIYVGQPILDLSKTLMFDFRYNYIGKKYDNKAELLFTDTDSLMYHIQTDDVYHDIKKDIKKKFDTSDYLENHPSGIKTSVNKKVIGKFKDEAAGRQITHFMGLRPKLYTFKVEEKKEGENEMKREKNGKIGKAKGVKKNVSSCNNMPSSPLIPVLHYTKPRHFFCHIFTHTFPLSNLCLFLCLFWSTEKMMEINGHHIFKIPKIS